MGWDDIWKSPNQQGLDLLSDGDASGSAQLFDDSSWRAVARYRAGDFAGSAAAFSEAEDPDGLYNLGNALARLGELDSAIDAYENALAIDPEMEDAAYNRDLIKDFKEEQQNAQGDQQGDQQSSSESGGQAQQSEGQSDSDQPGEDGASGDPDISTRVTSMELINPPMTTRARGA